MLRDVFQIPTTDSSIMAFPGKSIWVLTLCLFCGRQVWAGLTLDDFFPFGVGNGDSQLTDGDDVAESVPFLTDFYFYGRAYTYFGVGSIPA